MRVDASEDGKSEDRYSRHSDGRCARSGFRAAYSLGALHRESRASDSVVIVRGFVRVVHSAAHVPRVLPDEPVFGPVLLEEGARPEVDILVPRPVILGVSDCAGPDLLTVGNASLPHVEFLPEDESVFRVLVGRSGAHLHAHALRCAIGLAALLVGCLVHAVPVERLAPDLSVIVHVLNEVDVLFALLELELLHEVPRVLHLDDVGDPVRLVDVHAILADIVRLIVTRVRNLDIGPLVFHRLVMLELLILVPIGPVPYRIVVLPFGASEHLTVPPELGDQDELIKVDIGGEVGVARVDPEL